tara:strand:+ start:934 stop:1848 length:915 start_codon:yes stop_codon:yes gene_type:complete
MPEPLILALKNALHGNWDESTRIEFTEMQSNKLWKHVVKVLGDSRSSKQYQQKTIEETVGLRLGDMPLKMRAGLVPSEYDETFVHDNQDTLVEIVKDLIATSAEYSPDTRVPQPDYNGPWGRIDWSKPYYNPYIKKVCNVVNQTDENDEFSPVDKWAKGDVYNSIYKILHNELELQFINFKVSSITIDDQYKVEITFSFNLENGYHVGKSEIDTYIGLCKEIETLAPVLHSDGTPGWAYRERDKDIKRETKQAELRSFRSKFPTIQLGVARRLAISASGGGGQRFDAFPAFPAQPPVYADACFY